MGIVAAKVGPAEGSAHSVHPFFYCVHACRVGTPRTRVCQRNDNPPLPPPLPPLTHTQTTTTFSPSSLPLRTHPPPPPHSGGRPPCSGEGAQYPSGFVPDGEARARLGVTVAGGPALYRQVSKDTATAMRAMSTQFLKGRRR